MKNYYVNITADIAGLPLYGHIEISPLLAKKINSPELLTNEVARQIANNLQSLVSQALYLGVKQIEDSKKYENRIT